MGVDEFFTREGWDVVETLRIPAREGVLRPYGDMSLSPATIRLLDAQVPNGIYEHQQQAIAQLALGRNVCMATGTASGKSLVFHAAATELLTKTPSATVIAIYPLKALGREQEQRWRTALRKSGINAEVGRIDGEVPVSSRPNVVRQSRVLVLTPDIMHAWLLPNSSQAAVRTFLRNLGLIIIDEVHSYTGVFGSNSAFLFRRLQHLLAMLGGRPRFICASATIANPPEHLRKLLGLDFELIGPEADTSPRHSLDVLFVKPPGDAWSEMPKLLEYLAAQSGSKFIAFVDSRKQTEQLASIVARSQEHEEQLEQVARDHLQRLHVLPYRAGYEERDREVIQDRLATGSLSGVVSTSALELGIDIPHVDTGVLFGVPASSTNLWQRIGRVGRHRPGTVIVVNTGGLYDEAIFRDPRMLLDRPPAEGALYLQNPRIQYIHALCLARHGGEHDQLAAAANLPAFEGLDASVDWPGGFAELCQAERLGEIPPDLQSMKLEGGDDPSHAFPLRDVETQFRVEYKHGPQTESLGSLSHSQLMREAYPGAVYYYTTRPYRVARVYTRSKLVQVRTEKRYTTRPQNLPTLVFPNLTEGNIHACRRHGELIVVDCNLQVRETLCGFRERRGPNEFTCSYPTDPAQTGVYFDLPRFTRNYFTTGVVVTHPSLGEAGLNLESVAAMLYEALLMLIPFERADIGFAVDRFRVQRGPVHEGARFMAIYDQTYGSLRLSSRVMEEMTLRSVIDHALGIAQSEESDDNVQGLVAVLGALCRSASLPVTECLNEFVASSAPVRSTERQKVICPGSTGLSLIHDNQTYEVEGVFFNPQQNELYYRGRLASDKAEKRLLPVAKVVEVPGESDIGFYDFETGEVTAGNG